MMINEGIQTTENGPMLVREQSRHLESIGLKSLGAEAIGSMGLVRLETMRGISGGFGFLGSWSRFPGFVEGDKALGALVKGVSQKGLGITPRLIECDRRAY